MIVALQIVAIILFCAAVPYLVHLGDRALDWFARDREWRAIRRRLERESLAKYEPTRRMRK